MSAHEHAEARAGRVAPYDTATLRLRRKAGRECFTCRHWAPGEQSGVGLCKRRAPQVVCRGEDRENGQPRTFTVWPRGPSDQWCSEWAEGER